MRKLYFFKTILLLCALVAGSGSVWAADYATLPFNWDGGSSSSLTSLDGVTANGLGSDYASGNSPYLVKLDGTGDYIQIKTDKQPGKVTIKVKMIGGSNTSKITLKGSADGTSFSDIEELSISGSQNSIHTLETTKSFASTDRYVRLYFTKGSNVGVGGISIADSDTRANADLAYAPEEVTLELEEEFESPVFSNPHNLTVAYSSSNSKVATVHPTTGVISFVGGLGTAVITATSAANDDYKAGEATFTINVVRKTPTLMVADDFGMKTGESVTIDDDIYSTDSDGDVTITSGSPQVVSVAGGKLNALAKGSAVITVSVAQGENYVAIEKTFTINVTENPAVAPAGQGVGSGYTLVTDASTLRAGDKIIIVSGSKAMSTTQNTNNRGETSVTVKDNAITSISDAVQVITLEGPNDTGAWDFNVGNGYLYAASSSNNHLKTKASANSDTKATISIESSGIATITFQGSYTRNLLRYNSSSSCFSCYASGQNPVYIYRENVAESFDLEIGAACWRTIVTALDVTLPSGLKAYTAKISGDKAVLTEVDELAASVPYLLHGVQGTYTLTVTTDVDAPDNNDLAVSNATTRDNIFVLANNATYGVGFYKWNGGYIGAGRVYLPAPAGAREFIGFGFEDEAAGVSAATMSQRTEQFYDLQGRRVMQPQKGLYIVNGKKVLVK